MTHELHPICNIHQVSCSRTLALKLFLSSSLAPTHTKFPRPGRISSRSNSPSLSLLHALAAVCSVVHVKEPPINRHIGVSSFAHQLLLYQFIARSAERQRQLRDIDRRCRRSARDNGKRLHAVSSSPLAAPAGPVDATIAPLQAIACWLRAPTARHDRLCLALPQHPHALKLSAASG